MDAPLIFLSLGAGLLSILSPCCLAMVPSYFSASPRSTGDIELSSIRRMGRALTMGGAATLGFTSVLASVGLALAFSLRWVISLFPAASTLAGVMLLLMGGLMVLDIPNPLMVAIPLKLSGRSNVLRFYILGAANGVVALSCALPILLMIVTYAAMNSTPGEAAMVMLTYAAGVGVMLTLLTLAATISRAAAVWIRVGLGPHRATVTGSLVTIVAIYILMYQLYHVWWRFP